MWHPESERIRLDSCSYWFACKQPHLDYVQAAVIISIVLAQSPTWSGPAAVIVPQMRPSDIGIQSIGRGLMRVEVDRVRLANDLDANWELLAEPIQTVMRRYAVPGAYEQLKALTRGQRVDAAAMGRFIEQLPVPEEARQRLRELTPAAYVGYAARLARSI